MKRSTLLALWAGSLAGFAAARTYKTNRKVRLSPTGKHVVQITNEDERKKLLTFVVIGGGATGVETAGALADAVRNLIPRRYPTFNQNDSRVIVIEAGSKLLGHMKSEMAQIALHELNKAAVEVWLNTRAKDVNNGQVQTEDGRSISAGTVVWATGIRASDAVTALKPSMARAVRSG